MEMESYLRFVFALIFVLGLIALAAAGARRYGLGHRMPARSGKRRMSIVEVMPLDARRRLVLVQRDGIQHLLMLGHHGERVVETGIPAPSDFASELQTPDAHAGPAQEDAPR